MFEEYGIKIKLIKQFPAQNHFIPTEKQHWVATTFLAKISKGQPTIKEPHKCMNIGFFEMKKLPKPLSIITKLDLKHFHKLQKSKI